MAFGMETPAVADFADIVKYDANAGRMFKIDYNFETREKMPVDITMPPPRFAVDFGSLEVGYGRITAAGPDLRLVPESQPLPPQPLDKDEKGRLVFRPAFRLKIFGKVLDGPREWVSTATCVLDAVEDLYKKFRDAPEARQGKIPIVELTRTLPTTVGRGARQRTLYVPSFMIVGWTDRVSEMGERTVPPPGAPAAMTTPPAASAGVATGAQRLVDDDIPF
jgi:hypothetical protein